MTPPPTPGEFKVIDISSLLPPLWPCLLPLLPSLSFLLFFFLFCFALIKPCERRRPVQLLQTSPPCCSWILQGRPSRSETAGVKAGGHLELSIAISLLNDPSPPPPTLNSTQNPKQLSKYLPITPSEMMIMSKSLAPAARLRFHWTNSPKCAHAIR